MEEYKDSSKSEYAGRGIFIRSGIYSINLKEDDYGYKRVDKRSSRVRILVYTFCNNNHMDVDNVVDNSNVVMMDGVTTLAAVIANVNVKSSAPASSVGPGEIIYRSDLGYLQVNTGTAGTPVWTAVGAGAGVYLPLAGGSMTGDINMGGNDVWLNTAATCGVMASGTSVVAKVPSGSYFIIQVG
jgi:hypothetical protein